MLTLEQRLDQAKLVREEKPVRAALNQMVKGFTGHIQYTKNKIPASRMELAKRVLQAKGMIHAKRDS